jgi:translation initiation factor eIF-2B subunit alpha
LSININFLARKLAIENRRFKSRLIFKAVSEIFKMVVKKEFSRKVGQTGSIQSAKENIAKITERLSEHSIDSTDLIAKHASQVLHDGKTILVHSFSKSVMRVIQDAAKKGTKISVITTESHPNFTGKDVQKFCDSHNIPCKTVLDSSIALCISEVDYVFVGAEAVLENGGIVNKIGTFTIALCAKAYNKPFYVFAESMKFMKRFPLHQ